MAKSQQTHENKLGNSPQLLETMPIHWLANDQTVRSQSQHSPGTVLNCPPHRKLVSRIHRLLVGACALFCSGIGLGLAGAPLGIELPLLLLAFGLVSSSALLVRSAGNAGPIWPAVHEAKRYQ